MADEVWIVDGPIMWIGPRFLNMPFSARMTIIRCGEGDLFVHSPTPLIDTLKTEIEALGTPRWIIGPNRIHYWWIPEWQVGFPEAQVYLAPRIKEQAKDRIDFAFASLDRELVTRGTPVAGRGELSDRGRVLPTGRAGR